MPACRAQGARGTRAPVARARPGLEDGPRNGGGAAPRKAAMRAVIAMDRRIVRGFQHQQRRDHGRDEKGQDHRGGGHGRTGAPVGTPSVPTRKASAEGSPPRSGWRRWWRCPQEATPSVAACNLLRPSFITQGRAMFSITTTCCKSTLGGVSASAGRLARPNTRAPSRWRATDHRENARFMGVGLLLRRRLRSGRIYCVHP